VGERPKAVLELIRHFVVRGHGGGDGGLQRIAVAGSHPVHRGLDRALGHGQSAGRLGVRFATFIGGEKALQVVEDPRAAGGGVILSQLLEDAGQQGEAPLALVQDLGRLLVGEGASVADLGVRDIDGQGESGAPALLGGAPVPLVGKEVLDAESRKERKRPRRRSALAMSPFSMSRAKKAWVRSSDSSAEWPFRLTNAKTGYQ